MKVVGSVLLWECNDELCGGATVVCWALYIPLVTICTTRFNIHKFCLLPTQCIYVLCLDLRTNSDYFPIQHLANSFCN
jgi:hypothetical protein